MPDAEPAATSTAESRPTFFDLACPDATRSPIRRPKAWLSAIAKAGSRPASRMVPSDLLRRIDHPILGNVNNHGWTQPLPIDPRRFGRSTTGRSVIRIKIDPATPNTKAKTYPSELEMVARKVFPGYPKFYVNVAFACGRAKAFRAGTYTDPRSPWFNVFVGYYQIDVPIPVKNPNARPFGYRPAVGVPKGSNQSYVLYPEDLARLGQADWNYFSNYLYGVPMEALDRVGAPAVSLKQEEDTPVGSRWWSTLSGSGIEVSSAYATRVDGGFLAMNSKWLTELWRAWFGQPYQARPERDGPRTSFSATPMSTRMLVAFDQVSDRRYKGVNSYFRTFVFGGSVSDEWGRNHPDGGRYNEAFLNHQLDVLTRRAAKLCPTLGFDAKQDGYTLVPNIGVAPPIKPDPPVPSA